MVVGRGDATDGVDVSAGTGGEGVVRSRQEHYRVPTFLDAEPLAARAVPAAAELSCACEVDEPPRSCLLGRSLVGASRAGAEQHLLAAIAAARAGGDVQSEFQAVDQLVSHHESAGSPVRGRELATQMAERADVLGLGPWARFLQVQLVRLDWHQGACVEVVAHADALLAQQLDGRSRDVLELIRCIALVDLGCFCQVEAHLQDQWQSGQPGAGTNAQLTWVRAEAAMWSGRPGVALDLAEQSCRASSRHDPASAFGEVTRAWARVELGRLPGPVASSHGVPMLLAVPEETVALQWLCAGDGRTAAKHFTEAADRWSRYHRRGELRCRWAAGEALRRAGEVSAAVTQLEAAEVLAEQLSFAPVLARVRLALRRSGERRSAVRSVGCDGLTGREREVLQRVAQGCTNAQIATQLGVTRRTVLAQVQSASLKLGATSRGQAAVLATAAATDAPSVMVEGDQVVGVAERSVTTPRSDDLHHVDHWHGLSAPRVALTAQEAALLDVLLTGRTLGEAARALHVSRRTADRRLASARRALGADSTTQALVRARTLDHLQPA